MSFSLSKIKDKKAMIITLSVLGLIIILSLGLFFWGRGLGFKFAPSNQNLPAPDFLNVAEKAEFGLPPEVKVQSLKRNAAGKVLVYRIINSDQDIVLDPSKIGPISPHQKPTIK